MLASVLLGAQKLLYPPLSADGFSSGGRRPARSLGAYGAFLRAGLPISNEQVRCILLLWSILPLRMCKHYGGQASVHIFSIFQSAPQLGKQVHPDQLIQLIIPCDYICCPVRPFDC